MSGVEARFPIAISTIAELINSVKLSTSESVSLENQDLMNEQTETVLSKNN